jgi:hypothetical protein
MTTPDPTDARADGAFQPTHRSGYGTPTLDAIAQRVERGYALSTSEARVLLEEVTRLRGRIARVETHVPSMRGVVKGVEWVTVKAVMDCLHGRGDYAEYEA